MRTALCLILLSLMLVAGCLEAQESWPAIVKEPVLKESGWVQYGEVQKQSQILKIAKAEVNIKMATTSYRDEALSQDIINQVEETNSESSEKFSEISSFTSQLLTVRFILPVGIVIPSEIINSMLDRQIEEIALQNNIKNFHNTESVKIVTNSGKNVKIKNYEGYIEIKDDNVKVNGMSASWPDSNSTIIVFGILPKEDIVTTPSPGETVTITINEEMESAEMLKLIQNVE